MNLLVLLIAPAFALSLNNMTPLECSWADADLTTVAGKNACGEFKICSGKVHCTYVNNEVLTTKFKGNVAEANIEYGAFARLQTVNIARTVWSEFSGKNPDYVAAFSITNCQVKSGPCPSPRDCVMDRSVEGSKREAADNHNGRPKGQTQGVTR